MIKKNLDLNAETLGLNARSIALGLTLILVRSLYYKIEDILFISRVKYFLK